MLRFTTLTTFYSLLVTAVRRIPLDCSWLCGKQVVSLPASSQRPPTRFISHRVMTTLSNDVVIDSRVHRQNTCLCLVATVTTSVSGRQYRPLSRDWPLNRDVPVKLALEVAQNTQRQLTTVATVPFTQISYHHNADCTLSIFIATFVDVSVDLVYHNLFCYKCFCILITSTVYSVMYCTYTRNCLKSGYM